MCSGLHLTEGGILSNKLKSPSIYYSGNIISYEFRLAFLSLNIVEWNIIFIYYPNLTLTFSTRNITWIWTSYWVKAFSLSEVLVYQLGILTLILIVRPYIQALACQSITYSVTILQWILLRVKMQVTINMTSRRMEIFGLPSF